MVDKSLVSRQEAKIRELETRLEFERTQVKRLEVGISCYLRAVGGRLAYCRGKGWLSGMASKDTVLSPGEV